MLTTYINIAAGKGKTISHLTRVNSENKSSKIVFPKTIIKALDLKWYNDYVEWTVEMRGGRKVAVVKKLRRS